MMEKQQRLIDGEALKRWIEMNKANANPLDYNTKATYAECITMVEAMETIDAVPVVRCKDCVAVSVCNDELVCSRISEVMDGYYHGTVEIVKPDDYCSKGIRRSCAKMDGGAEDD